MEQKTPKKEWPIYLINDLQNHMKNGYSIPEKLHFSYTAMHHTYQNDMLEVTR